MIVSDVLLRHASLFVCDDLHGLTSFQLILLSIFPSSLWSRSEAFYDLLHYETCLLGHLLTVAEEDV